MKKGKNSNSKQAAYRGVDCPTCHAVKGEHCKSMGLRGGAAGNIMTTSCHDARIIASGNTPRSVKRSKQRAATAKARGAKRHLAGKKAWRTRLKNAGNQAYQEAASAISIRAIGNSSVLELVSAALNILAAERVHELSLHSHVANIHATQAAGVITLTING